MNRQQKASAISEIKEMFATAHAAFIVTYKGLDVASLQSLRKNLRSCGGRVKVTKARLMKLASQELPEISDFHKFMNQQIALVFATDDVMPVAKELVAFAKDKEQLGIVAGYFESRPIDASRIKFLASIPSRDVLMAQIAGTMLAVMSQMARAMQLVAEKKERGEL